MSIVQVIRLIVVESLRRGRITESDLEACRAAYYELPVGIAIMVLAAERLPVIGVNSDGSVR